MAAAWVTHLSAGAVRVSAAGTRPEPVAPLAVRAMQEAGVTLAESPPCGLEAIDLDTVTHLITVCDEVARDCPPVALTARHSHWGVSDPAAIAREFPHLVSNGMRAVRDNLRDRVTLLLRELGVPAVGMHKPGPAAKETD